MNEHKSDDLFRNHQNQLLKLVAKSFYKELVNYGVESSDIVTVSLHLLDYLTDQPDLTETDNGYFRDEFTLGAINDKWKEEEFLQIQTVSITPLQPGQIAPVCQWLKNENIRKTFIDFFPKNESDLCHYFFEEPGRAYFAINYEDDFVGIIGAENVNENHHNLEMKKFVSSQFSGKGIGKRATFLFLYYTFMILGFNKVHIHSMDTNIRNINLNSKFGFELEGIFFHEIFKDRHYYDVVRMGLLKKHWLDIYSD